MSSNKAVRVFVVDDEKVIATTLATILRGKGFEAESYSNPLLALKAASENHPALLISDVSMPEMTGVELAIKVKEICPQCKVLLFSGQAATVDLLEQARKDGHDFELLVKPVHPTDLLRAIGRHELLGRLPDEYRSTEGFA
jgi:DNA-binding NtrC family response regulator